MCCNLPKKYLFSKIERIFLTKKGIHNEISLEERTEKENKTIKLYIN